MDELNCDQCGDINLYARWITCIRCLDKVTVCYECKEKDPREEVEQVMCAMRATIWDKDD